MQSSYTDARTLSDDGRAVYVDVDPQANVDRWLAFEAGAVISLTFLVNYLTRKVPAFAAIIAGVLISSLSWLFLTLGSGTTVGGTSVADEDVLAFDGSVFAVSFDGMGEHRRHLAEVVVHLAGLDYRFAVAGTTVAPSGH